LNYVSIAKVYFVLIGSISGEQVSLASRREQTRKRIVEHQECKGVRQHRAV
jgi:hypothetical protein